MPTWLSKTSKTVLCLFLERLIAFLRMFHVLYMIKILNHRDTISIISLFVYSSEASFWSLLFIEVIVTRLAFSVLFVKICAVILLMTRKSSLDNVF